MAPKDFNPLGLTTTEETICLPHFKRITEGIIETGSSSFKKYKILQKARH